ncbi:MAG TPA: GyrI-like domain-containing protein [Steroidobacteraceae bacterium]|nr:GyrI-like domain-containing protein [Steroidobacteraceae bacterium]
MKIEITVRQPVEVAYLRYTGPFGEPLGRFWRATVTPWLAEHGMLDCPRYGVTLDDPKSTPAEDCRYDACVELPAGMTLPDAGNTTIAGGRYAVTYFKGTSAEIGAAWGAFVAATLGNPANRLDSARCAFERYPRGVLFDAKTGVFACELCLPLAS